MSREDGIIDEKKKETSEIVWLALTKFREDY